jgi:predicted ATPase/class 3 adenylate cyclase
VLLSESFAGAAGAGAAVVAAGPGGPVGAHLPAGTVTFLLTDIEGSTRMWEAVPEAMEVALAQHDRLLTEVIGAHGGVVVTSRGEGDSFFAVFPSAVSAVEAAGACQLRLHGGEWPEGAVPRVRMGLHTGEAHVLDGDYVDHAPINRCARVKTAAHGGQVLITKATRDLVQGRLGGGFGLTRLGEFRLRDLTEPELIYQLTHADLPPDFPPIRTVAERPGNLPVPVSSFIGRERELEQTAAALSEARVVTLTGPGGVGKTRLALQAAAAAAGQFADGAWLCELAPIREPGGVDDAVAAVFSVTARAGQGTHEALAEFLRGKQLLLVLDNCEHLIEGAAALAGDLARSCEQLVILATSREALGIDGERLVPVPSLEVPSAGADQDTIAEAAAVRLFTDRAAAVKPGFEVTAGNAAAVAAVVRRLDGIALAIELAAARVPTMTPAELARRLERSFAVLASGRRGAVAHHQTLWATIDWSFQLLADREQALLARLAVFAGGATLGAAEAVCQGEGIDPDAVFELLAALVARSLVVAEEKGLGTRYRLLETIRQYGEERLDQSGESELWRARHADYYAALLTRVRDRAHEAEEEAFWAVRLGAEQENLLAAWSWAISTGHVGTAFAILAGFAPVEIWSTYPLVLAGEAALGLPGAAEHPGYPLALAVSAVFAANRADVNGAGELSRQAAEANARQATPDWRVDETISAARSSMAVTAGAFADAARHAEQTAALARAGGDLADAAIELTFAVADHLVLGDNTRALPLANEALGLARQTGAPAIIARCLLALGTAVAETDPDQARACLHESRELSTAIGYQSAIDLNWAAWIAFLIGDQAAALELGRLAIRALQWSGDHIRVGLILHMIAGVLAATRPDAAVIIQSAAQAHAVGSSARIDELSSFLAAAVGEDRAQELHARGAGMDWDQAVAYALTQTAQALSELQSEAQP